MNANVVAMSQHRATERAPSSELRIHVGDLLARHGVQRSLRRDVALTGLAVSGAGVPEGDTVELDLHLEAIADGIVVTGHIAGEWRGECSRCLDTVEGVVDVAVHELFERRPLESETYLLDGEEIDLEPMVRDAIVLSLPVLPLCDDACLGLCPVCGVDRNTTRCDCSQVTDDPRWAALSQLEFPDTTD